MAFDLRNPIQLLNGRAVARSPGLMSTKLESRALILLVRNGLVRPAPNQAAEAAAAFGGIMMGSFESRRSLAAIR